MKTILHIIDTTGPGGAETVFINLAQRLSRERYRSIVVVRGKGWLYDELARLGLEPIIIAAKGSFNWRYLLRLCKFIKKEKVDLIQSHLLGSNVYSSLAGMITGVPVVAVFHGAVDVGGNESFLKLKFAAINLGAKRVITVSENLLANMVLRTPINRKKLLTIYNGVVVDEFKRASSDFIRNQFGWDKSVIIVGSLGNIRNAKGYDILLQAASNLKNSVYNFKFVIAGQGKGSLYDKLLALRTELKLEDVHFLGFNDDPAGFLSNLDVFLLSSTSEGFSIATIQAMASGIPVVATKSGGPEEIITHSKNGWLVEPGDPEAISNGLEHIVADPELMKTLPTNALDHVKKTFDMDAILSSYETIYNELI